jgi:ATP-dependent DNA helicase DinG
LVRSEEDKGVVALLDPRVVRRPWGKAILAALPPGAPITTDLEDVRSFFARTAVA